MENQIGQKFQNETGSMVIGDSRDGNILGAILNYLRGPCPNYWSLGTLITNVDSSSHLKSEPSFHVARL